MLFTNIVQFDGKVKRVLAVTAVQAVEIIVISYVVSLPFTLQFDSMFKGVGIAQNHSMIHQLLILWGLPVVLDSSADYLYHLGEASWWCEQKSI